MGMALRLGLDLTVVLHLTALLVMLLSFLVTGFSF